jgi:hypothetical protein
LPGVALGLFHLLEEFIAARLELPFHPGISDHGSPYQWRRPPLALSPFTYGVMDFGEPFVFRSRPLEAWVCEDGAWRKANSSTVAHDGRILSIERFKARFPSLPPLPAGAFAMEAE